MTPDQITQSVTISSLLTNSEFSKIQYYEPISFQEFMDLRVKLYRDRELISTTELQFNCIFENSELVSRLEIVTD